MSTNGFLNRPGITQGTLHKAGVRHIQADEAEELLGIRQPGLLIPYADHHCKPIYESGRLFARLRLDKSNDGMRYFQPKGSAVHAYIPPGIGGHGRGCDLFVAEGEFKSLSLIESSFAAIGIGGFYGFLNAEGTLVHELHEVIRWLQPGRILFVGDTDTTLNYQFADAAIRFASLVNPMKVFLPRIPMSIPLSEAKGVDDCKEAKGEQFNTWWDSIINESIPVDGHSVGSLAVEMLKREAATIRKMNPRPAHLEEKLIRLAAMLRSDPINQDRMISISAESLVTKEMVFRQAVRLEAGNIAEEAQKKNGKPERCVKAELLPWESPVNGAELLDEIRQTLNRFIVLPVHADVFLAIWVLHTYVFEPFCNVPYLHVTSPERECGKSTLAELLWQLCAKASFSGGMSAPSMYRRIDREKPTLLLDEWDTLGEEKRQAQFNILNTGFRWTGTYTICVGDDHMDQDFHTFCPKAIFGLSEAKLADTTRSRCFALAMQKQLSGEKTDKLTNKFDGTGLRRKCLRWANDNLEQLKIAEPVMPPGLSARQEDISVVLLAAADACGGKWPENMREAILHFCGEAKSEDGDVKRELLKDIKEGFSKQPQPDRFSSSAMRDYLRSLEHRPWGDWNEGKGISQRQISDRLRSYRIVPCNIRDTYDKVVKGYYLSDFQEAFSRYLPQEEILSATSATKAVNIEDSSLFQSATEQSCSGLENATSANEINGCSGGADNKGEEGGIDTKTVSEVPPNDTGEREDRMYV